MTAMAMRGRWYENDSRFIAAHYQPAVLIDLALSRGIDAHRLLRGTGLFHEDIVQGRTLISPLQMLQLIANAERLLAADDSSFLFGQRLWPGHYGAASHALQHAANLQEALELLCTHQPLLCPLLTPRLQWDEQRAYLYWLDNSGAGNQHRFLVEACMTAVKALSQQLLGERLPWHFCCRHARPRYIEQYWVHLNERVEFGSQIDFMYLPREYLVRPRPTASATAGRAAQSESLRQLAALGAGRSLLDELYDHLLEGIRTPPNLETVAQAFALSPATLKRKLKKHGTHFQEQLDLARKHVALWLYQVKGYSNDEVAEYLRFNDTTNFRRSFKRWTGLPPSHVPKLFGG